VKTPKVHRSDLVRYSHKPELLQVNYPTEPSSNGISPLLLALQDACGTYDFRADPYVISLVQQQKNGYDVSKQFDKLWKSHKTYCYDQLKMLLSKAKSMAEELGIAPMEYYLHQCMAKFEGMSRVFDQQLLDLSTDERQHLLKILKGLPFREVVPEPSFILDGLSKKVDILIDTLVAEANGNPSFTGLVFVEQRVWVAALAEILTLHPRAKDLLRIGTFVGTSNSVKRKANIATLAEPKNQQNTLDAFRAGDLNLILATSVLEEGVDVSSCHLVICFERPKNLKSFVQRRGRARKQQSRYFVCKNHLVFCVYAGYTDCVLRYLVNSDTGTGRSSLSWQSLEAEMRKAYEDDMRQVKLAEEREQLEENGERHFRVQSTE
jgi:ERCC4-related helicase